MNLYFGSSLPGTVGFSGGSADNEVSISFAAVGPNMTGYVPKWLTVSLPGAGGAEENFTLKVHEYVEEECFAWAVRPVLEAVSDDLKNAIEVSDV